MTRAAVQAIVVGASAGAIQALSRILPQLPASYPLPMLVVVHVPPGRSELVPLFRAKCRVNVKEAEDKEPILPGHVYFAPPDYHLLVELGGALALSRDEPILYSRPSINVLFESAADAFGAALVGVIMTGANEDGAEGLNAIAAAGGVALVQDPAEADMSTMPAAALSRCEAARSMSLEALASYLLSLGAR